MNKIEKIVADSQGCWGNEKDFFNWLRGQLRKIWSRHPIKITYKKSKEYPVPEDQKEKWGRAKLLINCEICGEPIAKSKTEVDHKVEAGTLKTAQDVVQFIYRLLFVSWEDLRVLCKECHAIVTYAARFKLPFREARIEKQIVAFCKKPAKQQIAELKGYGFPPSTDNVGNAEKRKECYRRHLKENS